MSAAVLFAALPEFLHHHPLSVGYAGGRAAAVFPFEWGEADFRGVMDYGCNQ